MAENANTGTEIYIQLCKNQYHFTSVRCVVTSITMGQVQS